MSTVETGLVYLGILAFCCFGYTYAANKVLNRLERKEYLERINEGLTPERTAYYQDAAERQSAICVVAFRLGVFFAVLFFALLSLYLMAWPDL